MLASLLVSPLAGLPGPLTWALEGPWCGFYLSRLSRGSSDHRHAGRPPRWPLERGRRALAGRATAPPKRGLYGCTPNSLYVFFVCFFKVFSFTLDDQPRHEPVSTSIPSSSTTVGQMESFACALGSDPRTSMS